MSKLKFPTCKEVFDERHHKHEMGFFKKLLHRAHIMVCHNCQRFIGTMELVEDKMKDEVIKRQAKAKDSSIEEIKRAAKENLEKSKK